MTYEEFLKSKQKAIQPFGFKCEPANKYLFDFQREITRWALKKGKAAIWSGTGTGKTNMELEFGHQVHLKIGGDILIVAPLAVAHQTVNEGLKFGYKVNYCRTQSDVKKVTLKRIWKKWTVKRG